MMHKTGLVAVVLCGVFAPSADAQIFRRQRPVEVVQPAPVYPPNYVQPYYSQSPTSAVSGPTVVVTPASNCPCPATNPGVPCSNNCVAPFRITHTPCPPSPTTTPITFTITPLDKTECKDVPFYGQPQKFQYLVDVPVVVESCTEVWKFETINVSLPCCQIAVCVPCAKESVKSKECRVLPKTIGLESVRRADGTIDVYALNVPGLPTKYVQHLKMSESDYNATFKNAPVPAYP